MLPLSFLRDLEPEKGSTPVFVKGDVQDERGGPVDSVPRTKRWDLSSSNGSLDIRCLVFMRREFRHINEYER
jgi:hypothetical protein